jgi:hypothetical protein
MGGERARGHFEIDASRTWLEDRVVILRADAGNNLVSQEVLGLGQTGWKVRDLARFRVLGDMPSPVSGCADLRRGAVRGWIGCLGVGCDAEGTVGAVFGMAGCQVGRDAAGGGRGRWRAGPSFQLADPLPGTVRSLRLPVHFDSSTAPKIPSTVG